MSRARKKRSQKVQKKIDANPIVWYTVFARKHTHTERICIMDSITQEKEESKSTAKKILGFFKRFRIGEILRESNAYKEQGIAVVEIVLYLFQLVFRNRSMYEDMRTSKKAGFGKDTVYRLRNSIHINWLKFTTLLSARIIRETIDPLCDKTRRDVFIVDDSIFERGRSCVVELLARVFDHAHHRWIRGFRMLTLGWSDGVSFLPINCALLSTENPKNRYTEAKDVPTNSNGASRRKLAQSKATDVVLTLIAVAQKAGIHAKYVLFDSWFTSPKMILALKKMGLDTVAMAKKTDKMHFYYQGTPLSDKAIYQRNKKRCGRAKYLLSVPVEVVGEGEDRIPARLVYVRNRNKRTEYLVLVCTDMDLSEQDIIALYGKRWDIEVFFKTCKSLLNLTHECRSISYDAMCSQTAIVFARYLFFAVAIREEQDNRSIGPLFCLICDEIPDVSFVDAFEKLQLFLEKLSDLINDSNLDISSCVRAFLADLPDDLAHLLAPSCLKFVPS